MQKYTFGSLTLTFDTLGVPFFSEKTKQVIQEMSLENATSVNKQAWKQRKSATQLCNRYCNFSYPGNMRNYELAFQHFEVARLVCNETYKRMINN
jgi:hypothetical protein